MSLDYLSGTWTATALARTWRNIMEKIRDVLRRSVAAIMVIVLLGAMPAPVFANGDALATETTTIPSAGGPTGPGAETYNYNETTGLWENDYYTFDPATQLTEPKVPLEYTYNSTTGLWDTYVWEYSAEQASYVQLLVAVAEPPAGAITYGGPDTAGTSTAANEGILAPDGDLYVEPLPIIEGTNPDNTNVSDTNVGSSDIVMNTDLATTVNSDANSGDSASIANTNVGDTSTGDALAMTNILNLLQSQTSLGGGEVATFTANIDGNLQGDFLIDPTALAQPAAVGTQDMSKLKLSTENNGSITNNINLNATSGDATARENTNAGNVSTGNADAIANVINMINSIVAANQSFIGVINIYGDYAGNILMPEESLNALLAASGSSGLSGSSNTTVDTNSTQSVSNNVNLAAASGNASAVDNTNVGNVSTGNGLTNLTILNLTGRQVVAENSLLVFVNVLGTWVGLIMDAPAGTTSAALGGGVTNNALAALASQTDVNSSDKFGITNNITANAASGNAYAGENTNVGNVATGDATASANIANIINSQFSLSNWFGVLFINVFGNWRGNFGVYKPPVVVPITSGISGTASGAVTGNPITNMKVFSFVARPASSATGESSTELGLMSLGSFTSSEGSDVGSNNRTDRISQVLGTSKKTDNSQSNQVLPQAAASDFNWSIVFLAFGFAGLGLVGVERVRTNLRARSVS